MKKTDKMSRAIGQLEKMYNTFNAEIFVPKFGYELPKVIITVQSTKGKSYGHSTCSRVWKDGEQGKYEINISAECLGMEIECTMDTMLHEMIHTYCRCTGIKEVSRGGAYHNGKFKELAEKVGLKCILQNGAGWNTDHIGNDFLTEFALDHDWSEIQIERQMTLSGIRIGATGGNATPPNAPSNTTNTTGTKSSTIKYKCIGCGCKIRSTKDMDKQLFHAIEGKPCGMFIRF